MADKKFKRYEFDGMVLDIPMYYDELSGKDLLEFPDFIANPIYTPEGKPLALCIEDSCEFAEAAEPARRIDCSDCKFFRRAAEGALFGVCDNPKKQRKEST